MNHARCLLLAAVIAVAVGSCTGVSASLLVSQDLGVAAYRTNSAYPGYGPEYAFDGNLTGTPKYFCSYGAIPLWVEVDLGRTMEFDKIDLCVSAATGHRINDIYVSNAPIGNGGAGEILVTTLDVASSGEGTIISYDFDPGVTGRYLQVCTTLNPGWVAWNEIQVFAEQGTISGVVRSDEAGSPPLAGATIRTPDSRYSTTTNEAGEYTLTVPCGDVDLIAFKTGYEVSAQVVNVPAGQTTTLDFALMPAGMGTVRGTVYEDLPSSPVLEGAIVKTSDGVSTTTTGADGTYSMQVAEGLHTIVVTKAGYTEDSQAVTVISGGAVSQDFTITSTTSGAIGGRVFDGDGAPLGGADVLVLANVSVPTPVRVTTKPDGSYWARVPAVSTGTTYSVLVTKPGCQTAFIDVIAYPADELVADITALAGSLVSQNLGAAAYTASSFYPGYPQTQAFDGDFVSAYCNNGDFEGSTAAVEVDLGRTIDLSSIVLVPQAPDDYSTTEVWVSESPIGGNRAEPAILAATIESTDIPCQPRQATFAAGTAGRYVQVHKQNAWQWVAWTEIQFFSTPSYVSGTVYSTEAGHPVLPGATVTVAGTSTTSGADGKYTLCVAPGTQTVTASKPLFASASAEVTTTSNNTTTQDFDLTSIPVGTLSGRVYETLPGEPGLAGTTVRTVDGAYSTTTDDQGNYSFTVPAGSVDVSATKVGFDGVTATVSVTANQTTTHNFGLTSTIEGILAGTVRGNEPGMPILAGAKVTISSAGVSQSFERPAVMRVATTDSNGNYSERVPIGSYLVMASGAGRMPSGTHESVSAGRVTTASTLSLLPAGALQSQGFPGSSYTSSGEYGIWYPAKAFDGDFTLDSLWMPGVSTGWLQVDMIEPRSLGAASIAFASLPGFYSYEVWASNSAIGEDRSAATLIGSISGYFSQGDVANVWFPAGVSARFLEIICTSAPTDIRPGFIEVQAFAPSSITYTPVTSIAGLKDLADGTSIAITAENPQVVTVDSGTFTDRAYYIEDEQRACGIKVVPSGGLVQPMVGDRITLSGIVGTDANGERYVYATSTQIMTSGELLKPLGTSNKSLGGLLSGVLSRAWGTVTYKDADIMYVDDGGGVADSSGHIGLRIALSGLTTAITLELAEGQHVAVTGEVGKAAGGLTVIRPRGDADITIF